MATPMVTPWVCYLKGMEIKPESIITNIREIFFCFEFIRDGYSVFAKFINLFID